MICLSSAKFHSNTFSWSRNHLGDIITWARKIFGVVFFFLDVATQYIYFCSVSIIVQIVERWDSFLQALAAREKLGQSPSQHTWCLTCKIWAVENSSVTRVWPALVLVGPLWGLLHNYFLVWGIKPKAITSQVSLEALGFPLQIWDLLLQNTNMPGLFVFSLELLMLCRLVLVGSFKFCFYLVVWLGSQMALP